MQYFIQLWKLKNYLKNNIAIINMEFENGNIEKKIRELYNLKKIYNEKIKNIEYEIDDLINQKYINCEIKNNGHKWITEREEGPYGERFTYCKLCNCER